MGWHRTPDGLHDDLPRSMDGDGATVIALLLWFLFSSAVALAAICWPLVLA